jgi:hypothetical protein
MFRHRARWAAVCVFGLRGALCIANVELVDIVGVMEKWVGFEEDDSPGVVAWFPVDGMRYALCDEEGFTVFVEIGSVRVTCSKPVEVLHRLLAGSLGGFLRKGSGTVTSVSLTREKGLKRGKV